MKGWLLDTNIKHNLCVLTRNITDFQAAQVPVLNPFEWNP